METTNWIEFEGGERPVPEHAVVEVKWLYCRTSGQHEARYINWKNPSIRAYRIIKEPEA